MDIIVGSSDVEIIQRTFVYYQYNLDYVSLPIVRRFSLYFY